MTLWAFVAVLATGLHAAGLETVAVDAPAVFEKGAPTALQGHAKDLLAVRFAPDGTVLTAAADQTARVWDPRTGRQLRSIALPTSESYWEDYGEDMEEIDPSASFSADGSRAVIVGSATVQVVRLSDGAKLLDLDGRPDSAALSADGRRLVLGASKGALVWDVDSNAKLCVLPQRDSVQHGAFSDDGSLFLTVVRGVRVWDLKSCGQVQAFQPIDESVQAAAFSPDGSRIVTAGSHDDVQLWDTRSGALLKTFAGHKGTVNAVAFSPDGRHVASGGSDRTVRLWDIDTGAALKVLPHEKGVAGVAFSADGSRLVAASGHEAVVWRIGYSKEELDAVRQELGSRVEAPAPDAGTRDRFQSPFE